jgi:hypothetical protein
MLERGCLLPYPTEICAFFRKKRSVKAGKGTCVRQELNAAYNKATHACLLVLSALGFFQIRDGQDLQELRP